MESRPVSAWRRWPGTSRLRCSVSTTRVSAITSRSGFTRSAWTSTRRPFVPTFWTIAKGQKPKGHVEQTWFAGAHCNVGGGYADSGLSDQALVWMIARVKALTGLEFNAEAVKASTRPNSGGAVVDSTVGWPLDHAFPHYALRQKSDYKSGSKNLKRDTDIRSQSFKTAIMRWSGSTALHTRSEFRANRFTGNWSTNGHRPR